MFEIIILAGVAFIVAFVVGHIYSISEERRTARCVIYKIKGVTDDLRKNKITEEEAFGKIAKLVKNYQYYSVCMGEED